MLAIVYDAISSVNYKSMLKSVALAALLFALNITLLYLHRLGTQRKIRAKLNNQLPVPQNHNPIFGHLFSYTQNKAVLSWHENFGKLVAFFFCDKLQVRIADLALIEQVFFQQSKNYDSRARDYRMTAIIKSILFNKGARWKKIRRLVQPELRHYRIQVTNNNKSPAHLEPPAKIASSSSQCVPYSECAENATQTNNHSTQRKPSDIRQGIDKLFGHFAQMLRNANTKLEYIEKEYNNSNNTLANSSTNGKHLNKPATSPLIRYACNSMLQVDSTDAERGFYVYALPVRMCTSTPLSNKNDYSQQEPRVALRLDVRSVMQALTLDVIFRVAFKNQDIDVTRGGLDENVRLAHSLVELGDQMKYKVALAVPITRLVLVPWILLFDPCLKIINKLTETLIGARLRAARCELANKSAAAVPEGVSKHSLLGGDANGSLASQESAACRPKLRRISDSLIESYKEGSLSGNEIKANTAAIVIAGFETTATTATYLIWCIAKYANLQEKLRHDIALNGIESNYLDMFIRETMRMYPALPNFVVRTPNEDSMLAGQRISRGTSVYMSVVAVHYDASIWQDPHQFDPERFTKIYPKAAYAPFGLGHRQCAGMHLALHELKAIAVALLAEYKVVLIAPQQMTLSSMSVFLTQPKYDVKVDLVPLSEQLKVKLAELRLSRDLSSPQQAKSDVFDIKPKPEPEPEPEQATTARLR